MSTNCWAGAGNYTGVMPGLYRDEGVVLRTIKLGEADRIVTVLTQGHGKVRAVAKGVRKTSSRFGARLEPMSRVALQCYRGRELDVVTQAETLEANRVLREEYGLLTHAIPMLEAVDQVAQEHEPNPALYRMLTGALRALAELQNPVVTSAFFWKLLSLEGIHPMLDDCARCGARPWPTIDDDAELIAFDLDEGGTLCRACARGGGWPLSYAGARPACAACSAAGLNGVFAQAPGPETHEVEQLGIRAVEHHVERRLRSTALAVERRVSGPGKRGLRRLAWLAYGTGRRPQVDGTRRQPGEAPGSGLPVVGHLRRVPLHLGLRAARRAAEAQREGRLVAVDGAAPRRRRRARLRDPHGARRSGRRAVTSPRSPTRSSTAATARNASGPTSSRSRVRARTAARRTPSPRPATST